MSSRKREPTEADGPLYRAAYERARELEAAQTDEERRLARRRLAGAGAAALGEGLLREALVWGAVLASALGAVFGATAGDPVWAVVMVPAGIAGIALVLTAHWRHWAFKRQWATIIAVLSVQCVLIVVLWQTH
jgi:hypothetical protein